MGAHMQQKSNQMPELFPGSNRIAIWMNNPIGYDLAGGAPMTEQSKRSVQIGGGSVVKYEPDRPKIHPNADKPWIRYDPAGSGSLTLSMGTYAMYKYLSAKKGGDPEPTLAELVIRRTEQAVYFELALSELNNPRAREFKRAGDDYRVLRDVKIQVEQAGLQVDPDTLYTMAAFDAEDKEYADVIAGNWSEASTAPRPAKPESQGTDAKAKGNTAPAPKAQETKPPETQGQVAAGKQDQEETLRLRGKGATQASGFVTQEPKGDPGATV
jgi:ribosomal protein L12E/L44/L45/RPP1/RPP2